MSRLLTAFGLVSNVLGSLILIWSYIFPKHYVDDDLVVDMDMKTGKYHQKKHLKEQKINFFGFVFLAIGFLFQLIALLI